MEINENKAQVLTAETGESFQTVAKRVQMQSARKIAFDNGEPIELDPNSAHAVCILEMEDEVLSTAEFEELTPFLFGGIAQAVAAGVLSPTRIKGIATALTLPKQPPFPYPLPEGVSLNVYWEGSHTYRYEWVAPPVEESEE